MLKEMESIRERLYDLALRLSSTDPDASHTTMVLYEDMADVTLKAKTVVAGKWESK